MNIQDIIANKRNDKNQLYVTLANSKGDIITKDLSI